MSQPLIDQYLALLDQHGLATTTPNKEASQRARS
jgi:hypothetical protein